MLLLERAVDLGSFSQGEENKIQELAERIALEKPAAVSISRENGGYKVRASSEAPVINERLCLSKHPLIRPDSLAFTLVASAITITGTDVEEVIWKKSLESSSYEVYLLRK